MEKVLTVLKNYRDIILDVTIEQDGNIAEKGINWLKEFDEAIEEAEYNKKLLQEFEDLKEALQESLCKECKYFDNENSVCFNDLSPLCAEFVDEDYCCIFYYPREELKDNE